jgi:hypothetical protein
LLSFMNSGSGYWASFPGLHNLVPPSVDTCLFLGLFLGSIGVDRFGLWDGTLQNRVEFLMIQFISDSLNIFILSERHHSDW